MTSLTGKQYIGKRITASVKESFTAFNTKENSILKEPFYNASSEEIQEAVDLATNAFSALKRKTKEEIAVFLEEIGKQIVALDTVLIERATQETALPIGRIEGERGRTVGQLNLFAKLVREGSWKDAVIDTADPDRKPFPKADIRQLKIGLGPVAVFGASNFPLAFSVAGGDTASALAAACPVIVKGHPAHPGTSELVAQAILKAVAICNMPEGTFSMVQGNGIGVGTELVKNAGIKAVGFTGSFNGGKALFDIANSRLEPIPVYAEMGSINPVFLLPEIIKEKASELAKGLTVSFNMGVGQFCTNPGLIVVRESKEATVFLETLAKEVAALESGIMLTPTIASSYKKGLKTIEETAITTLAKTNIPANPNAVTSAVYVCSKEEFLNNPDLKEEVFGPATIVVTVKSESDFIELAKSLSGHITATVHGTETDFENYNSLFPILEDKVGRIVLNGFPTGVEVGYAMIHGGPFPATTAPQTTSVGAKAINRFTRPVCYQDFPDKLLPLELQNANPYKIWRLVDGEFNNN